MAAGKLATVREGEKLKKYKKKYVVDERRFFAVGIETSGSWGARASAFLQVIAKGLYVDQVQRGRFCYDVATRVSVALQQNNGRRLAAFHREVKHARVASIAVAGSV